MIASEKKPQKGRTVRISLLSSAPEPQQDPVEVRIQDLLTSNIRLDEEIRKLQAQLDGILQDHQGLMEENVELRRFADLPLVSYKDLLPGSLCHLASMSWEKAGSPEKEGNLGHRMAYSPEFDPGKQESTDTVLLSQEEMRKSTLEWDRVQEPRSFTARKRPEFDSEVAQTERNTGEKTKCSPEKYYEELTQSIHYDILKRASLEQGKNGDAENPELVIVTTEMFSSATKEAGVVR